MLETQLQLYLLQLNSISFHDHIIQVNENAFYDHSADLRALQ